MFELKMNHFLPQCVLQIKKYKTKATPKGYFTLKNVSEKCIPLYNTEFIYLIAIGIQKSIAQRNCE